MGITHFTGLSVTSGGYYIGSYGSEREIINASGRIGSGSIDINSLAVAYDTGTVGVSGHTNSISTKLTTITYVQTQHYDVACTSGGVTRVTWSGGAFDILNLTTTGSANASTQIKWMAWGT